VKESGANTLSETSKGGRGSEGSFNVFEQRTGQG